MAPAARPRAPPRPRALAARPRVQAGAGRSARAGPASAALSIYEALPAPASPNGAPGSCGHHGAADLVARHLLHEQRHQLPRTVAVLVDFARRSDDVGPAIGLHIVLRDAAPARVEAGNDQHGVGVPLIGCAREPAKCLLVAARAADACRIERPKIELGIIIARLRRLLVASGHCPIGRGIGQGRAEVDRRDEAAGNDDNCSLPWPMKSRNEILTAMIGARQDRSIGNLGCATLLVRFRFGRSCRKGV